MIRRRVEEGARAARELGRALRSGPFRAALLASAAVHLGLFLAFGPGGAQRHEAAAVPLMRVRILAPARVPPPPPAVPARPGTKSAAVAAPPRSTVLEPIPPPAVPAPAAPPAPPPPRADAFPPPAPLPSETARPLAEAPPEPSHPPPPAPPAAATGPSPSQAEAGSGDPVAGTAPEGPPPPPAPRSPVVAEAVAPVSTAVPAPPALQEPPLPDAAALADLRRRIDSRKVYPQLAVRNGWEGRVLVEMQVDGNGGLAELRLLAGSGYDILDRATLAAVRRAAPFPPIGTAVVVPVEYRLTQ